LGPLHLRFFFLFSGIVGPLAEFPPQGKVVFDCNCQSHYYPLPPAHFDTTIPSLAGTLCFFYFMAVIVFFFSFSGRFSSLPFSRHNFNRRKRSSSLRPFLPPRRSPLFPLRRISPSSHRENKSLSGKASFLSTLARHIFCFFRSNIHFLPPMRSLPMGSSVSFFPFLLFFLTPDVSLFHVEDIARSTPDCSTLSSF